VAIDHDVISPALLPDESAIAAVTLAELAAGPHATDDKNERARRQDRLQWAAATWDPLPFDADAARIHGSLFAAARAAGQSSRSRLAALPIAATAAANNLPVYTRRLSGAEGDRQGHPALIDAPATEHHVLEDWLRQPGGSCV
jgi:predicted nucleic acid-binding protein